MMSVFRLPTIALLLMLAVPTAAQAQVGVGVDVGGTLDTVTDAVGGAADTATGVVDGAVDAVGGAVDGVTSEPDSVAPESAPTQVLDQAVALEAVRTARALPLEQIMARARALFRGDIVDAQLISVRGFLLYELKVIEADGDVGELYFYARSGEPVQTSR